MDEIIRKCRWKDLEEKRSEKWYFLLLDLSENGYYRGWRILVLAGLSIDLGSWKLSGEINYYIIFRIVV